ncbi:hypothetical protein [Rhizobium sp. SG570]|uniref:hypothetical protein n=1 Tax=Rhizobium sp. SG570 TaxID=2587113 RepID=UPI0014486308|nr:hypothetical protein [Rhizobium sp. SG570]NKJ38684.1 hypothetical protein [Rhizobium sp. SG570]
MTTIASSFYPVSASYTGTSNSSQPRNDSTFIEEPRKGTAADATSANSYGSQSAADAGPSAAILNFQSKIAEGAVLDRSALKSLGNTWELSDDVYGNIVSGMQMSLEANYRTMPEEPGLSSDPRTDAYATVVVDGKVVATIDNQGVAGTDNDVLGAKLSDALLGSINGTNGPDLAQARAEQLARLLGGKIVKSDSAIAQSAFNSLPPSEAAMPSLDYEAMKKDPLYAQVETLKQKRADYLTQQN